MARLLTTSRRLVTQDYPPAFLAPFLHHSAVSTTRISQFSTTDTQCLRTRDLSRNRGVSALRRTGLRFPVEMSKETLPQPVLDPTKRSKVKVSKDHGLWSFFGKERRPINLAEEDAAFGRPWAVEELRHKSFEDLHCLWWVCVKERNRLATQEYERKRAEPGYGDFEALERLKAVKATQRAIKHTLTERFYAWEDARKIATKDPEVDLKRKVYDSDSFEDDSLDEEEKTPEDTLETPMRPTISRRTSDLK